MAGRSMKMKRSKKQLLLPSIKSLPEDLLIEVLVCVGSYSVTDLFNVKQSCKDLYKTGVDAEVLRRISLENVPAVPWHHSSQYYSFMSQCQEKHNPEALFKRGTVEYFSGKKQELGIELLRKAASLGHEEAAYTLGLILLCTTNYQLKAQALGFLKTVDLQEQQGSPSSIKIRKCRKRVKDIIQQMWTTSGSLPQSEPMCTSLVCKRNNIGLKKSGWLSIEDEELPNCEACRWDREIVLLRKVLA